MMEFVYLLAESLSHIDDVILHLKHSIPTVAMVVAMCDHFGDKVLNDAKDLMPFLNATMQCCLHSNGWEQSHDMKIEMLGISLTILTFMLNAKVISLSCLKGIPHSLLQVFLLVFSFLIHRSHESLQKVSFHYVNWFQCICYGLIVIASNKIDNRSEE